MLLGNSVAASLISAPAKEPKPTILCAFAPSREAFSKKTKASSTGKSPCLQKQIPVFPGTKAVLGEVGELAKRKVEAELKEGVCLKPLVVAGQ